jgi:hypothetical protein
MEPAQSSPSPLIPSEIEESAISDGEFLDFDRKERKHLRFDQREINSSSQAVVRTDAAGVSINPIKLVIASSVVTLST